eukprot:1184150-Prorocentrum_minimum.AAC.3
MIICKQCKREFHVECLAEHNIVTVRAMPGCAWFCSDACKAISRRLEAKVLAEPVPVGASCRPADEGPEDITSYIDRLIGDIFDEWNPSPCKRVRLNAA